MPDQAIGKNPEAQSKSYVDLLEYSLLLIFVTLTAIVLINNINSSVHAVWVEVNRAITAAHAIRS